MNKELKILKNLNLIIGEQFRVFVLMRNGICKFVKPIICASIK